MTWWPAPGSDPGAFEGFLRMRDLPYFPKPVEYEKSSPHLARKEDRAAGGKGIPEEPRRKI